MARRYLFQGDELTVEEIAERTGYNYSSLRRRLSSRVKDGLTKEEAVAELETGLDLRETRRRERTVYYIHMINGYQMI